MKKLFILLMFVLIGCGTLPKPTARNDNCNPGPYPDDYEPIIRAYWHSMKSSDTSYRGGEKYEFDSNVKEAWWNAHGNLFCGWQINAKISPLNASGFYENPRSFAFIINTNRLKNPGGHEGISVVCMLYNQWLGGWDNSCHLIGIPHLADKSFSGKGLVVSDEQIVVEKQRDVSANTQRSGLSNKTSSAIREDLTMTRTEAKHTQISVDMARQRVASAPLDWRSFNDLGIAYYREGFYDEAIAAFEQALALHPITTTIEAEQKQQRALDSQRQALMDEQARQRKAQNDAAMNQMFQSLLGGIGSMPGLNARTLSMLSVAQGMANVASQIPLPPQSASLPQEKMESSLRAKREVASVYTNLGTAHSAKKNFSLSISAFESALNLDPSKTVLLRSMAECNFALADYGKCIVLMKRFLAISHADISPKCYMLISDAFQALGMDQEADKAFDAGVRAYKKWLGANPSAASMTIELGWAYAERYDRLSEAIECFHRVLAGDKSNPEALKGLATSYYGMSDYDQALKVLQVLTVPDVKKENASYAWYLSGRIYDEMGLKDDALNAFRKAVDSYNAFSHPGLPPTYITTASAAIGQEQAVQRLELAVTNDPLGWNTFIHLYGLAFAYEKMGRDAEAIEILNRCLTIRPKHSLARKSLEKLTKKNSGACDHALRAADKAVSQNDMTTAMQYLAKAYQLMPEGKRKKETQGKLLRVAGQAKSVPPLTEGGQRHFLRGNAALKSAKDPVDIDRAITEYRWAIVQSPWIGNLYLHASVATGVRHRYSEAIEYLTLFLTASPESTNLESALNKLHELEYQQAQDIRALSALSHFN